MTDFKFFKDKLKKYCITKEEQQIIEDAYVRMLDQHNPEPKKRVSKLCIGCKTRPAMRQNPTTAEEIKKQIQCSDYWCVQCYSTARS